MKNKPHRLKIVTILGTRPEIIRLSRILPMLDRYFDHRVVYTNQNYDKELSSVFFKEFSLRKPDYFLDVKAKTLGSQIGNIISDVEAVLVKEKPDGVFILGDTNSSLSAIIARRLKILLFHMEAGNRSFDRNVPEEVNRTIVDHISDYNICYTEHSRRYLLAEGIAPGTIYVVGSPLTEVFSFYASKIEASPILEELQLKYGNYLLASAHREENIDNEENLRKLWKSFEATAEYFSLPMIVSLHPRTRKRLELLSLRAHGNIILSKPFGFFAFNKLQKNAFCVLSDSGSVPEEAAILGFPAIQIRVSSERPEAFDKGVLTLTGFDKDTIINAITLARDLSHTKGSFLPENYKDTHIALKVTKLLMGLSSLRKQDQL